MSSNKSGLALLLLLCLNCIVIDAARPICRAPVESGRRILYTLNFDNVQVVPCQSVNRSTPWSGLYLRQADGSASWVTNTSSTPSCHSSSGGQGPFGLAVSPPNVVGVNNELNMIAEGNKTFSFISFDFNMAFVRDVALSDDDPLIICRLRAYDACNQQISVLTEVFHYNQPPFTLKVQASKLDFTSLKRLKANFWWWYVPSGVAMTKPALAYVDNIKYVLLSR